ncbi:MAG: GDSL-type esterase/lipase family protein [Acetatifactor sp.]
MKRILCFGDSNTWGLVAGTKERYEWGIRWTSRLQEALPKEEYQVIEEGLCGRTTVFEDITRKGRNGAALLPVLFESHYPVDMVILMLGTNDCKTVYQADAEQIGDGIRVLLSEIRQASRECKILLISPILLGTEVWKEKYDPEFSRESVEVSKMLPPVLKRLAVEWEIDYLAASDFAEPSHVDWEHLDAQGHEKLAEAVIEKVYRGFERI